jgi:Sulfatase-modifying factor enzyme 1
MLTALLTLESRDHSTLDEKVDAATQLAKTLAPHWRFERLEPCRLGDQEHVMALFVCAGLHFALLPGYSGYLGYDSSRHRIPASGEMEASAWHAYLAKVLTPLRRVALRPFLLATSAELLEGPRIFVEGHWQYLGEVIRRSDVLATITAQGYRFPTSDEWEYACSGGARTFFRWGDTWPTMRWERPGRRGVSEWRDDLKPNAFGLLICQDPWDLEYCAEPHLLRGGDGGNTRSVGAGLIEEWVPFATPYYAPFTERSVEIGRKGCLRRAMSLPDALLS